VEGDISIRSKIKVGDFPGKILVTAPEKGKEARNMEEEK